MRKGSMSLALMFGYVGGGNLAITELQRVMTGKITSVGPGDNAMTEEMFWGFIGNIGMDRYALERMGEREDLTAYWTAIAPPALVIPGSLMYHTVAATGNLIYDTDRPIPGEESDAVRHGRAALKETGVGRIIDLMLLGGAEEYNEKEERKRLFGDIEFDR